jgi:cell wall-associated NlpC family hydrolase
MEWAEQYIGLQYRELGRDRDGLDCWGLVVMVMREQLGLEVDEFPIAKESGTAEWPEVERREAQPFDVCVMYSIWRHPLRGLQRAPIHCGLVAPRARVLHIERHTACVCIPIARLEQRNRIKGFYRYRRITT